MTDDKPVAVLGAGVMGTGIATLLLGHGLPVMLVDVTETVLATARDQVRDQARLATIMGAFPAGSRTGELVTTTALADIHPAGFVVESVTERPGVKAEVLAGASAAVAAGTPVISNTSAIPIDTMARWVARPADFLGVHFMNPPYLVRTVELIIGSRSGAEAVEATRALLAAVGQTAVTVGDGPGFVVNRVLQRMINEAARIVEEGVADAASVDAAFTGCLGHRTGPLATADIIGLDTVVDSLRVLLEHTGDEGYRPAGLLLAHVGAGRLGRKTGLGFYPYGDPR